jgi:hypothetical protein
MFLNTCCTDAGMVSTWTDWTCKDECGYTEEYRNRTCEADPAYADNPDYCPHECQESLTDETKCDAGCCPRKLTLLLCKYQILTQSYLQNWAAIYMIKCIGQMKCALQDSTFRAIELVSWAQFMNNYCLNLLCSASMCHNNVQWVAEHSFQVLLKV